MGSDKALLEWRGEALVARQARLLEAALTARGKGGGNVAIVGNPARYGSFGFPVVADLREGSDGPLAGIEAALASPYADEWNLVIACDMPFLDAALLARLLSALEQAGPDTDCILAHTARGAEPLCSLYRRRFLAVACRQLDAGRRKVRDALDGLELIHFQIDNEAALANVNTPADWQAANQEAR